MFQSGKAVRLLVAAGAALVALAMAVPAQAAPPAPPYTQFAGCPDEPATLICVRSEITGGHFQMGNKDVPINKTIVLTGGTDAAFGNFKYNSEGGLQKVKLEVPGGVIGLTGLDWLIKFLGVEALKLYAVTELAGVPNTNVLEEPLELPVKAHMINPVLGNNCYIGTDQNPIALNMQVAKTSPPPPNQPIEGVAPEFVFENEISKFVGGTWVDNSFAAPGASGCALTLFGFLPVSLDGVVNVASELPSAAGKNETTQDMEIEATDREIVYP